MSIAWPVFAAPWSKNVATAPVGQSDGAAAPLREEDARVNAIAYRMGLAAARWCQESVPLPGWILQHLAEYDPHIRPDLVAIYALDRGPGIVAVAPGSAAATAGFEPGDTLLSVNGLDLASLAPPRLGAAGRVIGSRVEAAIEQQLQSGSATVRILRNGQVSSLRITAQKGCPARVRIAASPSDNAVADGRYATFSTRSVRVAATDNELAALVGHELAHNFLEHFARRTSGADRRPKRDQEAEADAFSLRLMAVAGYDPRQALAFYRRILDPNLLDLLGISSHYPKGPRLAALRTELASVEATPNAVSWQGITLPRQ